MPFGDVVGNFKRHLKVVVCFQLTKYGALCGSYLPGGGVPLTLCVCVCVCVCVTCHPMVHMSHLESHHALWVFFQEFQEAPVGICMVPIDQVWVLVW